jgi:Na+-driven multidrug efflux pump
MFYLIGRFVDDTARFSKIVSSGILLIAALYGALTLLTAGFARPLVVFMAQRDELVSATVSYIRFEVFGLALASFARYFSLILIVLKRDSILFMLLLIQVGLSVGMDSLLVSSLPFSLRLGVNGVAITSIVVNATLVFVSAALIVRSGVRLFDSSFRLDWSWLSE